MYLYRSQDIEFTLVNYIILYSMLSKYDTIITHLIYWHGRKKKHRRNLHYMTCCMGELALNFRLEDRLEKNDRICIGGSCIGRQSMGGTCIEVKRIFIDIV